MSFVHRFGSALNANLHFHCCVIDGLFSAEADGVRFDPAFLTDRVLAKVQQRTRRRVLKLFQRRAWLPADAVEIMQAWEHDGGFSVNAEVWVPSWDRAGLERLIRYCARPLFAGERLAWLEPDQRLVYHLPKPRPDGQTALSLTPREFLDHLASLIPPPRKHRHTTAFWLRIPRCARRSRPMRGCRWTHWPVQSFRRLPTPRPRHTPATCGRS